MILHLLCNSILSLGVLLLLEFPQICYTGRIDVRSASEVTNTSLLNFQLYSYKVGVFGKDLNALDLFDMEDRSVLERSIKTRGRRSDWPSDGVRGVPCSNWVKFKDSAGRERALFVYKSIHRCNHLSPRGSVWLYDSISNTEKERKKTGDSSFITRSSVGVRLDIHTVTTDLAEAYLVEPLPNMTASFRTESDIRVVQIPNACRSDIQDKIKSKLEPTYVLVGSYMLYKSNWNELQFLAVVDSTMLPLSSWTLYDEDAKKTNKKQKNWSPFWVSEGSYSCKLLLSKKYAPVHVVGEFTGWAEPKGKPLLVETVARSDSPSSPPSDIFVRGSAPVVSHPNLKPGYALGCIHVKGKHKVYRHALYIQKMTIPYEIVSFSQLFSFNPLRNIEFVMSIYVKANGDVQLTHGSADCEPRISLFSLMRLKQEFVEYFF